MTKIMFIFGTRPEAIKMAPVIKASEKYKNIKTIVCVTGQHRELLDQVLKIFRIKCNYDLSVMKKDQSLFYTTSVILIRLEEVLKKENPDMVLVQGDTTTAFIASLASFYLGIKVAHIEAGLRTNNKLQPFPEEINRRCADVLSDIYFPPTQRARDNLIKEGIDKDKIFVTGNTIVDALNFVLPIISKIDLKRVIPRLDLLKRIITVTVHRRENFAIGIDNVCRALKVLIRKYKDIEIVVPIHPNPNVIKKVDKILGNNIERIHIISALDYFTFLKLVSISCLILSDSGGIQEEAPSFNKPVLILRNVTERPEVIECGLGRIVGTDKKRIISEVQRYLNNDCCVRKKKISNPFGDGFASERVIKNTISFLAQ